MSPSPEHVAGSIYDLGYRRYDGPRLGRVYAVRALYLQSLRGAFGLGRRTSSKIIPITLAVILLIPAAVQLGIAALATSNIDVIKPENYFGFVQLLLALFCAAVAPELVGRDQRTHTLSLYFSRSLLRRDYALAKLAALVSAILIVSLAPQVVLFAGSALASSDSWAYLQDNWDQVLPILASGAATALFMASISLAIAAQTPRRAFATGGVLAFFVVMSAVGGIIFATTSDDYRRYSVLLDPFTVLQGLTYWLFRVHPEAGTVLDQAHLSGWLFLAMAGGVALACTALLIRRFQGVQA